MLRVVALATWDRLQAEPAMFYALVEATIALVVAFGLSLTPQQTGAILAVVAIVLGILTRRVVTPTRALPNKVGVPAAANGQTDPAPTPETLGNVSIEAKARDLAEWH